MIEVSLICKGTEPGHEHIKSFPDPVDWQAVAEAVKATDYRCSMHPEAFYSCDWE
jgi:hypothetical protein